MADQRLKARLEQGPGEPVHSVELGQRVGPHTAKFIRTDCGLSPHIIWAAKPEEDVTCEPCLAAGGGDALDAVERLLVDARTPAVAR